MIGKNHVEPCMCLRFIYISLYIGLQTLAKPYVWRTERRERWIEYGKNIIDLTKEKLSLLNEDFNRQACGFMTVGSSLYCYGVFKGDSRYIRGSAKLIQQVRFMEQKMQAFESDFLRTKIYHKSIIYWVLFFRLTEMRIYDQNDKKNRS